MLLCVSFPACSKGNCGDLRVPAPAFNDHMLNRSLRPVLRLGAFHVCMARKKESSLLGCCAALRRCRCAIAVAVAPLPRRCRCAVAFGAPMGAPRVDYRNNIQGGCGGGVRVAGRVSTGFHAGFGVDSRVALNFTLQTSLCFSGLRARPVTAFILLIRGKQFAEMMRRP